MSLFNKVFASIGIGSAKVDTILEKDTLMIGEEVKGVVNVKGGNVEQDIDSIYLSLHTTYIRESNDRKYTDTLNLGTFKITESFTIKPNESKQLPFTFLLPIDTPMTFGKTKVWIQTGLDIKNAVDPTDKDMIKIVPNPLISAVFHSLSDLGFQFRKADCEKAPYFFKQRLPIIQEFEFVPTHGPFRGKLDELEIVFYNQSKDSTNIFMEVDRKARGISGLLAEALEIDESKISFQVTASDIPNMKQLLEQTIRKYS
jgi:sporulation-control protein